MGNTVTSTEVTDGGYVLESLLSQKSIEEKWTVGLKHAGVDCSGDDACTEAPKPTL